MKRDADKMATMFKIGDRVAVIHLHRVGKDRRCEAVRVIPASCSLANKLDETIRLVVNGTPCRKRITSWATTNGSAVDWRSKRLS
jgi:hypothetical protein